MFLKYPQIVKPLPPVPFILACFIAAQTACGADASTVSDPPDLCIAASEIAAKRTGVPLPILLAVTLTETGRNTENGLRPWPWAVNQDGTGHWFTTAAEAVQFVEDQLDLGLQNFDVGCFQINHRWHSKGFRSTVDMFSPTSNALYAARFLSQLYAEYGDWSLAAAAYHSRTPEEGANYQAKFDTILASLSEGDMVTVDAKPVVPRANLFPLLLFGKSGGHGSLVPLNSNGQRLIGDQP